MLVSSLTVQVNMVYYQQNFIIKQGSEVWRFVRVGACRTRGFNGF